MDAMIPVVDYQTIKVRWSDAICYLQIHRPDAHNTINDVLLDDLSAALDECDAAASIVVLEGLPEVFCFGADLEDVRDARIAGDRPERSAEALYALWLRLKRGPYVTVAHVRGKVNAGGVGFAAACDLVLCDAHATFSLSELLFGLVPACVLPFLIERIGSARAHAMTLMTRSVTAEQALAWGLADGCSENSDNLLRLHLLRLRMLPKAGVARYKRYAATLNDRLEAALPHAVACNGEAFTDAATVAAIDGYVRTGKLPWEARTS